MNEARRLAYLRALGVDSYVRRALLQSAADEVADPPPTEQPPVAPIDSAPTPASGPGAEALLGDLRAGQQPQRADTDRRADRQPGESTLDSGPAAAEPAPPGQLRFSLHFYRPVKELAVICEIPFMANQRIQQGISRLLVAVLRAIGCGQDELARPDRFNWPLGADDDASAERAPEACQALGGFLRKRLEDAECRVVLVFGDHCQSLLAEAGLKERAEAGGSRIILTHGLAAMLQVPALKRAVWDAVREVPALLDDLRS